MCADSVAVFRMVVGVAIAVGAARFLLRGWVDSFYLGPEHHLTYASFEWIRPLPAPWMHLEVVLIAACGVAMAVGWHHRAASVVFLVAFAHTELIEASLYLNHYWFLTVVGVLLCLLPVHHHWSVDAARGRVARIDVVPRWVVWALRAQVGLVYLAAGVAKLNADWLWRAEPMSTWLADRADLILVGPLFELPASGYVASWFGALFDCTIVVWLSWRRTRPYAYAVLVAFHLATAALFQIGLFPWIMMAAATVFFEPTWPRRRLPISVNRPGETAAHAPRVGRVRAGALIALAVLQLWLPIRHLTRPGDVRWNEDGYYLAWRVMLTEKAGFAEFEVTDPTSGRHWVVGPELVLTEWQSNHAVTRPDLLHATALLIADDFATRGVENVEVRVSSWVTMNGHPTRRLVDPATDVASVDRGALPPGWVAPAP